MIAKLKGFVSEYHPPYMILDVHDVGYEVYIPEGICSEEVDLDKEVELYIRQIFREDSVTLYGFLNRKSKDLFDKLIEVKGCGPKLGMAIIGELGDNLTIHAITTQDTKKLKEVSGVGVRLAERIILELKGKLDELFGKQLIESYAPRKAVVEMNNYLIDALLSLGYKKGEAEKAAQLLKDNIENVNELTIQQQIKLALKEMRK